MYPSARVTFQSTRQKFQLHNFSLAPQSVQISALHFPAWILNQSYSVLASYLYAPHSLARGIKCLPCEQPVRHGKLRTQGRAGSCLPAAHRGLPEARETTDGCCVQALLKSCSGPDASQFSSYSIFAHISIFSQTLPKGHIPHLHYATVYIEKNNTHLFLHLQNVLFSVSF